MNYPEFNHFLYITFLSGVESETHNNDQSNNGEWSVPIKALRLLILLVGLGCVIYSNVTVLKHGVDQSVVLITDKSTFLWQETQRTVTHLWEKVD